MLHRRSTASRQFDVDVPQRQLGRGRCNDGSEVRLRQRRSIGGRPSGSALALLRAPAVQHIGMQVVPPSNRRGRGIGLMACLRDFGLEMRAVFVARARLIDSRFCKQINYCPSKPVLQP